MSEGDPAGARAARRLRLETLRESYAEALRSGTGPALLAQVASEDPVLLMELGLGPKAPGGPAAAHAVLSVRETLVGHLSEKALFVRLVDLAGQGAADEVLAVALRAHPVAPWALRLIVERAADPGALLAAEADRDSFGATCDALLGEDGERTLSAYAERSADPLPAAVAWHRGQDAVGLRLAARALQAGEAEPVFFELVAAWGPETGALCLGLLPHLSRASTVRALAELAPSGSPAAARLALVARGLRD